MEELRRTQAQQARVDEIADKLLARQTTVLDAILSDPEEITEFHASLGTGSVHAEVAKSGFDYGRNKKPTIIDQAASKAAAEEAIDKSKDPKANWG